VQGLCAAEDCRHCLNTRTNDVVVRVLFGKGPARGLAVSTEHTTLWILRLKLLLNQFRPKQASGSQLCDLHIKVHSNGEEEGHSWSDFVYGKTCLFSGSDVLDAVGKCEGKFEFAVSASLLHVIARNGDGVELGHVLACVAENVLNDFD
jgi:hypothetical protein